MIEKRGISQLKDILDNKCDLVHLALNQNIN